MPMKSKMPVISAITGFNPILIIFPTVIGADPAIGYPATMAETAAPTIAVR